MHSRKNLLVAGGILLLLLSQSVYTQLEMPAPGGPYQVGRTVLRWVDASRPESLTEDPGDFREVIAMVWYPAEPGTGVAAGYFPGLSAVAASLAQSGELEWWQAFGLGLIRSEMPLDATPLRMESPFPVVIFSSGNGTNAGFYSGLAGEMASHGYIVLGLNHPYDVPAVRLLNGEVASYHQDQWALDPAAHQAYIAERMDVRIADIRYLFDQIVEGNVHGRFAGLMDLDAVAVAGHSLGGIAASEACKAEIRFKSCLNFDGLQRGGPFSMNETALAPQQPFLFLTKEARLPPTWIERFGSMPEGYWIIVHDASHQSFTDGPLLQPSLLPIPSRADRFLALIQQYSLAFLDHALRGQASDLLSTSVDREDVSVRVFSTQ